MSTPFVHCAETNEKPRSQPFPSFVSAVALRSGGLINGKKRRLKCWVTEGRVRGTVAFGSELYRRQAANAF